MVYPRDNSEAQWAHRPVRLAQRKQLRDMKLYCGGKLLSDGSAKPYGTDVVSRLTSRGVSAGGG